MKTIIYVLIITFFPLILMGQGIKHGQWFNTQATTPEFINMAKYIPEQNNNTSINQQQYSNNFDASFTTPPALVFIYTSANSNYSELEDMLLLEGYDFYDKKIDIHEKYILTNYIFTNKYNNYISVLVLDNKCIGVRLVLPDTKQARLLYLNEKQRMRDNENMDFIGSEIISENDNNKNIYFNDESFGGSITRYGNKLFSETFVKYKKGGYAIHFCKGEDPFFSF
jgi:hypothetical protein